MCILHLDENVSENRTNPPYLGELEWRTVLHLTNVLGELCWLDQKLCAAVTSSENNSESDALGGKKNYFDLKRWLYGLSRFEADGACIIKVGSRASGIHFE